MFIFETASFALKQIQFYEGFICIEFSEWNYYSIS